MSVLKINLTKYKQIKVNIQSLVFLNFNLYLEYSVL